MVKNFLVVMCVLFFFGTALCFGANGEKLLMDFEKGTLAKIGGPVKEKGGVTNFALAKTPGKWSKWQYIDIKKGDATQGEWAFIQKIRGKFGNEGDSPMLVEGNPNPDVFSKARTELNLYESLKNVMPTDWSGYELLWIDMKPVSKEVEVEVGLEDLVCEPFIARRFTLKPGQWQTVEINLEQAVKERNLDLKNMINLWVRPWRSLGTTELLVDNIRLAKKGQKPKLSVITDDRPMKLSEMPKEITKLPKPDIEPNRAPLKDEKPIIVDISKGKTAIKRLTYLKRGKNENWWAPAMGMDGFSNKFYRGRIAAFDNNHILLVYKKRGSTGLRAVLQTNDGGKTWKGLDGASGVATASRSHGHADGADSSGSSAICVSAADDTHVSCGGTGFPIERIWMRTIDFKGKEGWKMSDPGFVSSGPRHCGGIYSGCRVPSGRLWAAWQISKHREDTKLSAVQARYSNDGGKTWDAFPSGTAGYISPKWRKWGISKVMLVPYKENVACIYYHEGDKKGYIAVFDGTKWESKNTGVNLKGMRGAISFNKTEIYISLDAWGKGIIYRFDGETCKKENVNAGHYPLFSVANGKLYIIDSDYEKKAKAGKKLRLWERKEDGTWEGPKEIVTDENHIESFSVPTDSPPNFIPVAWHNNWSKDPKLRVIKILRVPVE